MRILVLTSRYTATRDIIAEDFGRQTRLFSALSKRGHSIDLYCADYRKKERKEMAFHGMNALIRPFSALQIPSFILGLLGQLKKEKYDLLIATSDPLWGVVGKFSSRMSKVPFLYDLHDNYETYDTYRFPSLPFFERRAIRGADLVSTVSYALEKKIAPLRKRGTEVIQNGVDVLLFKPMDRIKCRDVLSLPRNSHIIAYAGSIQRAQGVDTLILAFREIRKKDPLALLVVAGRFYGDERKHFDMGEEGIVYMGSLSQQDVAKLINAANVAIVPNKSNDFTEYCFPYKVVEYMACNTPIVATSVGDVAVLLRSFKGSLCKPNDPKDMAKKIFSQMKKGKINYRKKVMGNTWDAIAKKLDSFIVRMLGH